MKVLNITALKKYKSPHKIITVAQYDEILKICISLLWKLVNVIILRYLCHEIKFKKQVKQVL